MKLVSVHAKLNLVRFAHNWNAGILERWNDGFGCTAMLSVSKKKYNINRL